MTNISFTVGAWEDYLYWQPNDNQVIIIQCRYHY